VLALGAADGQWLMRVGVSARQLHGGTARDVVPAINQRCLPCE
jgi:hypothetical protein